MKEQQSLDFPAGEAAASSATESKTVFSKGRDGWTGLTNILKVNGYDWRISSHKGRNGNIETIASAGTISNDGPFTSFATSMFENPSITLLTEHKRCTEKAIRELHSAALLKFDELLANGEIPSNPHDDPQITVGQILVDQDMQNRSVLYEVKKGTFGLEAKYINLKTLHLGRTDRLRNYEKKFGIGTYYLPGETMSEDEVSNLLIQAKELEAERIRKEKEERERIQKETAEKIEQGKKLVNVPSNAVAVIVAHYKSDKSDLQTDYHAHSIDKTVYLAFSYTKRNLFPEMRKAAARFPETQHLENAPKSFEQRHTYSMGSGTWLGESHHHGWEIRKGFLNPENGFDKLYIAAAEGRYFCNSIKAKEDSTVDSYDNFILSETIHSKKKHQLFVASVADRVERDVFLEYKQIAKSHGGYYSSYNRDGAIPGFQFRGKEEAEQFIEEANLVAV